MNMNMKMKMKMKASKKMRGFMCQSPGAAAVVCMTGDHRSVIVPRKPDRTTMLDHHHHAGLLKNTNYIRLGGSRNIIAPPPPPSPLSPVANKITSTLNKNLIIPSLRTSTNDHHEDDHKKQIQKIPTTQLAPSNQVFQVVVMRVSIHCQGCAGKLKKHLSKMEGVTSFSIDPETKRVTVMGHVSPTDVLESISKVKKAEFWPS